MTNAPFKSYGFNYEYNGKYFAFHVVAESEEDARSRAAAMGGAKFFGELKEANDIETPND